jgi:probable addiction module antidote protein
MSTTRTTRFDAADYLENREDLLVFLGDAFDSGDPDVIRHAIGTAARASGRMKDIAKRAGVQRESLYKSFGPHGNPSLATAVKAVQAMGFRMRLEKEEDSHDCHA